MTSSTSNAALVINQLPTSYELPIEYPLLREHLILHLNRISNAVNRKEGSYYELIEQGNSQQYFVLDNSGNPVAYSYRPVYRTIVNFGALPNNTTKSVAHNIAGIDPGGGSPSTFSFTRIYGTASKQVAGAEAFIPIPYVDMGAIFGSNAGIYVDKTNVNITTTADLTAFAICYVILEYLKY